MERDICITHGQVMVMALMPEIHQMMRKDTEDTKILNHRVLVHVLHIFPTHMLEVDASRTSAEI